MGSSDDASFNFAINVILRSLDGKYLWIIFSVNQIISEDQTLNFASSKVPDNHLTWFAA